MSFSDTCLCAHIFGLDPIFFLELTASLENTWFDYYEKNKPKND